MTTEEAGFPADSEDVPTKVRGRMTWKKWLAIGLGAFVLLAGVGVGTYLLMRPSGTANRTFSQDVQATSGDQTQTVTFDGTLAPQKESDVNFTVSGTVTKVYVKSGEKVSQGQKLARIDDTDLQNAVDLAQANLTTAQANLTEVYDNSGSSAAVTSAKAQVSSSRAALASAKEDLKNAVLRARVDGTVASVSVEVGDSVGSGSSSSGSGNSSSGTSTTSSTSSAQVVVISVSKWKVTGSVGAADLSSLKAGQAVSVTTDAASEALTGKVTSVGIVASSTSSDGTATFPVEVALSGTHTGLYSGTTATAVITTGSYSNVLTVPTAAITSSSGKTVVTKVTGSTTAVTEVQVGTVFGTYTQIKSGLSAGDTVRITFTRPSSTSTSSSQNGSVFGGGIGGGLGGGIGGAPGGGAPPAGTGQGGR